MDLLTLGKSARDDITPFSRCARYYKTSHRSIPESSLLSIMPITSFFFRTQSAYTGEDLREKMRLQVLKTITKCLQSKHGLDSTGRAELSVFIAISFHFILLALSIFGFLWQQGSV